MRFLIAETHDPDHCVQMRPIYQQLGVERFRQAPLQVLAAWTSRPEHTYWFVVEAETYEQLEEFCRPRELMRTKVTPIRSLLD